MRDSFIKAYLSTITVCMSAAQAIGTDSVHPVGNKSVVGQLVQLDAILLHDSSSPRAFIVNAGSNLTMSHVTVTNSSTTLLFSCATDNFPSCTSAQTTPMQVTMQNLTITKDYHAQTWFWMSNTKLTVTSCTFFSDPSPRSSTTGMYLSVSHSPLLSLSQC